MSLKRLKNAFLGALGAVVAGAALAQNLPTAEYPADFRYLEDWEVSLVCASSLNRTGVAIQRSKDNSVPAEEVKVLALTFYTLQQVWTKKAIRDGATSADVTSWLKRMRSRTHPADVVEYCRKAGNLLYSTVSPAQKEQFSQEGRVFFDNDSSRR